MTARLSIVQADNPVRQILLEEGRTYSVGRDPSCTICINDAEISRTHARLEYSNTQWVIRDTNSKNGFSVAGKVAHESNLANNTWIGIGTMAMRFEELTAEQARQQSNSEQYLRRQTQTGRTLMNESADITQVLENLMKSALSVSATDRAFVMLTQDDGDLRVACSKNKCGSNFEKHEFIGSASAVKAALKTRKPVVTCDATAHQTFGLKPSIISSQTRALICLPMTLFGRVLGVIYADSLEPGKMFTELDVKILGELADHGALLVAAAQLGEQLDAVDHKVSSMERLLDRVATQQHRIPDLGRHSTQLHRTPSHGVRWSWIESQA